MRVKSRKIGIAATGAALAVLTGGAVRAADMPFAPPLEPVAAEQPVLFGTGWYLRGDLGMAKDKRLPIDGLPTPLSRSFPNTWTLGLGAGYRFNSWLRTDLTFDWRQPETAQAMSSGIGGCLLSGCYGSASNRLTSMQMMGNVYFDLGTWAGLTPYIGAGVGLSRTDQRINVTPGGGAWAWATKLETVNLAWAGMLGVSYAVTPNLTADVGYRYLNMGRVNTLTSFGILGKTRFDTQEIRVGVRYTPDF